MNHDAFFVTGATGKTGFEVAKQLREQGKEVRALVRARTERTETLAKLGCKLITGDLKDAKVLTAAMQDVKAAYFCPPFDPKADQAIATFAQAARQASLGHIVLLSQWLASESHPSLLTRHSWLAEKTFESLQNTTLTVLNPGFFADNYLRLIGFAAQLGVLPSLSGTSRNAPPSNEDIARVAVTCMTDAKRHAGKTYRPTGSQLLSTKDMAAILSRVLGHKVLAMPMPLWLFLKAARHQGVGAYEMSGFRYYIKDHIAGAFELGAPNDHVLQVTGQRPEDFERIARRYATRPEAQTSFASRLKAAVDFICTPIYRGYNLDRIDAAQGIRAPPDAAYAMNNKKWLATHT